MLHIRTHRITKYSPREPLRAQAGQVPPAKQRHFVDVALQTIATRRMLNEVASAAARQQPFRAEAGDVRH